MKKKEERYQKCVKDIIVDTRNKSREDFAQPMKEVVSIHFNRTKIPMFKYAPRYTEIKDWLSLMVKCRGKEEVERELGVKIK